MARAAVDEPESTGALAVVTSQPLPRVEPAFAFAGLLELSDASVAAAFESAAFVGLAILFTSISILI